MTQPKEKQQPKKSPGPGHNTVDQRLLDFITRIERLKEEQADLAEDIKTIFAAAKHAGYKPKRMRDILRLRKMETDLRELMIRETNHYMTLCGLAGTPLGDAAHPVSPATESED